MANTITSSLPPKSNIVDGQLLRMTIYFNTSEKSITPYAGFEIQNPVNLTPEKTSYTMPKNAYSVEIVFIIKEGLADQSEISFDIVPKNINGFTRTSFKYTVVEIDNNSLALTFGNGYLNSITQTENVNTNIPPNGLIYSKVFATIKDKKNGQGVSGIPITIMSNNNTKLDSVRIFKNHKDAASEVKKETLYNKSVFYLKTEENGMIVFYVYPATNTEFVLNLQAGVTNTQNFQLSKNSLFVIDDNPTDPGKLSNIHTDFLAPPSILEASGGALIGDPDSTTFSVEVDRYDYSNKNDIILFYVNGKYSNQEISVGNTNNLDNYFFDLPYSILPQNEDVALSYIIATHDASIKKSASLGFSYNGGGKAAPLDNINRIYDPCVVYSSFGALKETALIQQHDLINYFSISRYYNNTGHSALYIAITGTDDTNDKTKVPFGFNIVLTLYIDSYKKKSQYSFSFTMPTNLDKGFDHTATYVYGIPIDYLNHIESYPNSSAGNIYFDYYAYDPSDPGNIETKYYGNIWQGKIDTE
ncbi:conserved protein of unknown function [Xenorhabdus poinarii G6]|uniref:DUF4842 domain-containing protein n=1 Tax=Xenorhabdus poinarii G6 TaxID=1354304 RepID=A0A068QYH1_9GAMM|nr:hypothetical protein [Xenorhabdus poinarii]CDG19824.1 conserved protein of unknown function [Xenorhabdus poinarii G6]